MLNKATDIFSNWASLGKDKGMEEGLPDNVGAGDSEGCFEEISEGDADG